MFINQTTQLRMRLVGLLILVSTVTGCSLFGSDDDRNKPMPLADFKPTVSAQIAWRAPVGSGVVFGLSPTVVGDSVFAASSDGVVTKVDLATGAVQWKMTVAKKLAAGAGSDGKTTAVATPEGEIIALDEAGAIKWTSRATSDVSVQPWVGLGVVVVRSGDYRIQAFNAANGERIWSVQRPGPSLALRVAQRMIAVEGLVITGLPGGRLMAIEPLAGSIVWEGIVAAPRGSSELERVNDVVGSPVVLGDFLCAVSFQGRISCFNISQGGRSIWAKDFSSSTGMAIDPKHAYSPDARDNVAAFATADGAKVWRQDGLRNRRLTAPATTGQYVVVGDFEGYAHVLSADSGEFAARLALTGGAIHAQAQTTSRGVLLQTGDSSLVMIELK
jgi:outer membrane protein assembly factor BamB